MRALVGLVPLLCCLSLLGCSSRSPRDILEERQSAAHPRAAAYGADGFYADGVYASKAGKPGPDTEFFFKHCSLVGRHPYPSVSDWECTDAR